MLRKLSLAFARWRPMAALTAWIWCWMMVPSLIKRTVHYAQCSFCSLAEVSCQEHFYKLRLSQRNSGQQRRKHRHHRSCKTPCPWQSWVQSPVSLSQARTTDPRQISPFKLTLLFMSFLQKWSSLFTTSQHSSGKLNKPKKPPQSRTEQLLIWDPALSQSDSRFHMALTVLI